MGKLFNVSSSPHVRDRITTQNLMFDVVIAMIPASVYGVWQFGFNALLVLVATVVACVLSEYVYEKLMKFPNREEIFGKQQIYDCNDRACAAEPNLLINATEISFEELWDLALSYDGVMFPAHIDKTANSLIANLGFVPPDSRFVTAEVKDLGKLHSLLRENPYLADCRIISNSDAHYLEHINEPRLTLEVEEKSREAVVETLRRRIGSE